MKIFFFILRIIAIVVLLYALERNPYSYYTSLKIITCLTSAVGLYILSKYREVNSGWSWVFIGIIILFNPIFPVHLDKSTWQILDVVVALILFASLFLFKFSKDRNIGIIKKTFLKTSWKNIVVAIGCVILLLTVFFLLLLGYKINNIEKKVNIIQKSTWQNSNLIFDLNGCVFELNNHTKHPPRDLFSNIQEHPIKEFPIEAKSRVIPNLFDDEKPNHSTDGFVPDSFVPDK